MFEATHFHKFLFYVAFISSLTAGYMWGLSDSDPAPTNSLIIEMEAEEQIYHSLVNKKKPVFLYFFIPGHIECVEFNEEVEDASKLWSDKVDFIRVNCKKNIVYCRNRDFGDVKLPTAEVILPYQEDENANQQDLSNVDTSNAPFLA